MWRPDRNSLAAVRAAIDEDPKGWKRARDGRRFKEAWRLGGSSLKRPPRGYVADHPLIDDLRRTDHIAICDLKKSDVTRPDLVPFVAGRFARAKAYMAWQAAALGLPF
jgi:uncharacterized protein (TIGR02453 family)